MQVDHPFYIKTVAGTGTGNQASNVTNNGTESGNVVWTPSEAGTYYYQCSAHSGMVGTITINSSTDDNYNSSFEIVDANYTSFAGETYDAYLIETEYCVVYIEKSEINADQLSDSETLIKIFNRVDDLYNFYKSNLPKEPLGGNPNYSFKTDIFFGPPSCGSGCGLVGSKGIEVSGFQNIFFNLKYDLNVNRDVIVGYELGRNFSNNDIHKISLPYTPFTDEKNGGFYEGFAAVMYTDAYDEILTSKSQRELNETILYGKFFRKNFNAYINDLDANPYNSLALWEKMGPQDPSRGSGAGNSPSYNGGSILKGIINEFNITMGDFLIGLEDLNTPKTIKEALSNIALATAYSTGNNTIPFFKNVLKFDLTEHAISELNSLPKANNKLIADENILWFISPIDSIPLNIRSLNYLDDNAIYKIKTNDKLYSESINGNNLIPYNILKNKDSLVLKISMEIDNQVVDEYSVKLKKRHNINILDYSENLYSYYLSNAKDKNYINDSILTSEYLGDSISNGLLWYNIIYSRNRTYKLEGEIKHNSEKYTNQIVDGLPTSGWSGFGFRGPIRSDGGVPRVGYDIGSYENSDFIFVSGNATNSNLNIPDNRLYQENQISISTRAFKANSQFKNIIFKDITDTDNDGIIDFEDNCPNTANEDQADTDGDGIGDVCDDDKDGDTILNTNDNCPETSNEDQADMDGDGIGDVCDDDKDGDTILNTNDNCPETANEDQADIDGDGLGDVCDDDKDGDTILNTNDNCPETANEDQADIDGDGLGDVCDDDKDGDTILNTDDNCPETANEDQVDMDGDGVGDGCDDDIDGDGVLNADDNCPETPLNITVDVNGCEIFTLPLDNNKVSVTSATCIGNTDGSIGLSVEDASYSYTVTVTGQDDPIALGGETKTASVTGLGTGTYTVCFKVDGQDGYEQCFEVNIGEPKALSAFIDVDNDNRTTSIQLSGSSSYNVEVNGERL